MTVWRPSGGLWRWPPTGRAQRVPGCRCAPSVRTGRAARRRAEPSGRRVEVGHRSLLRSTESEVVQTLVEDMSTTRNPFRYKRSRREDPEKGHHPCPPVRRPEAPAVRIPDPSLPTMDAMATPLGPSLYRSPLLRLPGAVEATGIDAGTAWHYGDPIDEQRAAETGSALFDRSTRSILTVSGPDRLTWLHTLTSQFLSSLADGESTQALVLSPQGHVEQQ